MLTDFQKFCTVEKRMKFSTKYIQHYPSHLRHVARLPWKIKNVNFLPIFSTYGRKCKHTAFLSPLPSLFIHKFPYSQCLKQQVFSVLIANKIFHVTVLLLVYFYDQFVAPEIRYSRCHSSVCQQSAWYSVTRTIF